jgi:16S rRNA (adenine(1408)-N(1))-methyltransferase
LPYLLAAKEPDRLLIGLDANAAGLRPLSGRAHRDRLANLVYVRAAVESLPSELAGIADRVTVILPWGSLLAGVAGPAVDVLLGIRTLCQTRATLTVLLGVDADRDRAEAARLALPSLDERHLRGPLAAAYAAAGLPVTSVRPVGPDDLARWPSTWARRLAFGRTRPLFWIEAQASLPDGALPRGAMKEPSGQDGAP